MDEGGRALDARHWGDRMTVRLADHPFMEHAAIVRDLARALRDWIRSGSRGEPPVDIYAVPSGMGESEAWATYRRLCGEAARLECLARTDIAMGTYPEELEG